MIILSLYPLARLRLASRPGPGRGGGRGPARCPRREIRWCQYQLSRNRFDGWHGSSGAALWENIKQKQKRCFSPARLARTHRTGRTHSLVLFSPPTSLFARPLLDEIHTSACARRCARGSSWCTRCRPATSSSRCSCSLPWRWQVVELDPQRPTALLARLSPVECGKLDALVKVAWWCKRQQRIPAEDEAAKGRTLPAMAAAIAPTAAVTRQVRV